MAILNAELQYGKGIYSELVFASQRRSADILKSLLDNESVIKKAGDPSSAKEEIISAVTKAVMESGGVEINKLEKAIDLLTDKSYCPLCRAVFSKRYGKARPTREERSYCPLCRAVFSKPFPLNPSIFLGLNACLRVKMLLGLS